MSLHNVLFTFVFMRHHRADLGEPLTHLFKGTVGQLRITAVLTPLSQCRQKAAPPQKHLPLSSFALSAGESWHLPESDERQMRQRNYR